jgi:hypothetical protein
MIHHPHDRVLRQWRGDVPKDKTRLRILDFRIKSWGQGVKRGKPNGTYKLNEARIQPHCGVSRD